MTRLIRAIDAERPVHPESHYDIGYNNGLTMAKAIIMKMDAAPKSHGLWEWNKEGWWQCSECGCGPAPWESDPYNEFGLPPFCHACGAEMSWEE